MSRHTTAEALREAIARDIEGIDDPVIRDATIAWNYLDHGSASAEHARNYAVWVIHQMMNGSDAIGSYLSFLHQSCERSGIEFPLKDTP